MQQQSDFLVNQFEIFLKDDFLPLYLQANYEAIMQGTVRPESAKINHLGNPTKQLSSSSNGDGPGEQADNLEAAQMIAKFRAFQDNERVDHLAQKSAKNISTQGSWSNREEEWYFINKRLLFATQSSHAADTWVLNLNELLAQQNKQPN